MNTQRLAQQIVHEAISSPMFSMNRFDVYVGELRVYGRLTQVQGETVWMIQNIVLPSELQGKGLFNAICSELRKVANHRIYIQCVGNQSWANHLTKSRKWTQGAYSEDFISTK